MSRAAPAHHRPGGGPGRCTLGGRAGPSLSRAGGPQEGDRVSAEPESRGDGSARRAFTLSTDLDTLAEEELLDLRFCELGISIEGSSLEPRVAQLNAELAARDMQFRPHYWLSDDWFTPDGVPGVALPFYLAHPRLTRLEEKMLLEAEGNTPEWCMKILRHEAGHAVDNAYRLRRRRNRMRLFGRPSTPYPEFYTPKPYSKSFVLHLDSWYAQSHPDEDFAETFALWLTPDSHWEARYSDWPALKKLRYVDRLMKDIAPTPPLVRTGREVDPIARIRRTLRSHYKRKREHYGLEYPDFYDRDLRKLFSAEPEYGSNLKASRFLNRIRKELRRMVSSWTGEYQYTIDQVLEDIIARCDEMNLRLKTPEDKVKLDFLVMLTVQTMNYLHSGRHRMAL